MMNNKRGFTVIELLITITLTLSIVYGALYIPIQFFKEYNDYSAISEKVIDEINILNASFLAMNNAVSQLKIKPEFLLIDGNRFINSSSIPHKCIVKGDAKFASIAAASILAKTYRDEWMQKISTEFPHYGWDTNKGYATLDHQKAILEYGLTLYHRKSFHLKRQLRLEF